MTVLGRSELPEAFTSAERPYVEFGRLRDVLLPWWRRLLLPVALLAAWEALVNLGLIDRSALPAPSQVARALVDLAEIGRLWPDVAASLGRIIVGFSLATTIGVAIGALMLQWRHRSWWPG